MPSLWDDPTIRLPAKGGPHQTALWAEDGWWGETRVGVFETLQVVRGRPVALGAHWERLRASLRTVGRPGPPGAVRAQVVAAARAAKAGGVRVDVVSSAWDPTVSVCLLPRRDRRGEHPGWRGGVAVVTAPGRAHSPSAIPAQVKSIERLPSIMAWGERASRGIFEILWRNPQGYLTEGTVSNLLIVQRGQLVTPPTWVGVLPGVVREAMLRLAARWGIPAVERPFTRHELYTATEALLTNSLIEVVAVRTVDGRRIGGPCPGPITRRLQRGYAAGRRR